MKILVLLLALLAALALAVAIPRVVAANRKHDPVEYYRGWDGYWHPITLSGMISKEEAEALAAQGAAYLIGYFGDNGKKLTRVVKMYRGALFFEYVYAYHPNGKIKSTRITKADGMVVEREYDQRGRRRRP